MNIVSVCVCAGSFCCSYPGCASSPKAPADAATGVFQSLSLAFGSVQRDRRGKKHSMLQCYRRTQAGHYAKPIKILSL